MKLEKFAVGAAVLAAVAIGVSGCQSGGGQTGGGKVGTIQFSSHDSPIDVGGGSVYGSVGRWNWNTWTQINNNPKLYGSRSSNNDYIKLTGFSGLSSPSTIQGTGGWLITIITKDSNHNQHSTPSISFCSNITSSTPQPYYCLGTSLDGDRGVYVEITSATAQWDWITELPWFKHRVEFDDVQPPGCVGTKSPCDEIASITITTVNNISTAGMTGTPTAHGRYAYGPYTCTVNKDCSIEAGK
jgi:hypothetical protein